jgi:SOS-response transcriptional repressor LexA
MARPKRLSRRDEQREANAERVLAFIRAYWAEHGIAPSMGEIGAACYLARSSVLRYLDLLEARGHIWRYPGVPRSIVLLDNKRRL